MKAKHYQKISVVLITIMALLWTANAVVADDRRTDAAAESRGKVDIDRIETQSARLTIKAKAHDRILTDMLDFAVTGQTEFVTKKGLLISFDDLKVPCRAVIHYEPSTTARSGRTAWRVNIQRVAKNATNEFSDPEPY
jgi:hypothetical protein